MNALKPIEEKAIRLVLEGKVHVRWRADDYTAGSGVVDGDHGTYKASFNPEGRMCTCPAHVDCSHAIALELAVMKEADDMNALTVGVLGTDE